MEWELFEKNINTHRKTEKALDITIAGTLFLLVILCAFSLSFKNNHSEWNGEYFTETFYGTYLGAKGHWQSLPDDLKQLDKLKEVHLKGHFSTAIEANESVMFSLNHINIIMFVNGEQVFDSRYGEEVRTTGYVWQNYISGGISPQDEIEFIITYNEHYSGSSIYDFLTNIKVGSELSLVHDMLSQSGLSTAIGFVFITIGLVALTIALTITDMGLGIKKRIVYFAGMTISGGFFGISNLNLLSLFVPHPEFNDIWSRSSRFFMVAFLFMYIYTLMSENKCKIIVLSTTFFLTTTAFTRMLLHLFNIYPLHATSRIQIIVTLILFAVCAIAVLFEAYSKHNRMLRNFMRCFWVVVFAGLFDAFTLYFKGVWPNNRYNFIYIGFIVFAFLQIFQLAKSINQYYININKLRDMEAELAESRISIMLSQIQPHFLYNSLATISALSDEPKVIEAIDEFSSFLRSNMDSLSSNEPIIFSKELEHTKHYLSLEKMRFDERLNVEYDIKARSFLVPTLTLQPIVENSVKYGIKANAQGVTVKIASYESDNGYVITVTDNGPGIMTNDDKSRSHIGLTNVSNRLKAQCNGELLIQSGSNGTTITIIIPGEETL